MDSKNIFRDSLLTSTKNNRFYSDEFHFEKKNISIEKIHEETKENKTNLILARFYILLCSIFFCINDVAFKVAHIHIPGLNFFLLMTFRFIFFSLLALFFIYKENIKIQGLFKIKEKKWFAIRILGSIFGIFMFRLTFDYIRL